ncbi:MAG: phytanoyl-CoA dioxygenase family protein [Microthrixaceae bacterium]
MTSELEDRTTPPVTEVRDRGYTILRNVLTDGEADAYVDDLARIEHDLGTEAASNDFEGTNTLRVYNLLRHGEMWQRIPTDEQVLPIVDAVLGSGCLISSLSSIRIQPGETPQPIHSDDQVLPIALPEPPVICNTMWALTDFTEDNGATRLVPGSHAGDKPEFGHSYGTVAAEMDKGDVLVWHGRLWHGGGANTTDADRIGIAMNYCAGWIRQQENQQLGLPVELVRNFEPRLRELVGYGTYAGLVGHIEKRTVEQILCGDDPAVSMLWDAT